MNCVKLMILAGILFPCSSISAMFNQSFFEELSKSMREGNLPELSRIGQTMVQNGKCWEDLDHEGRTYIATTHPDCLPRHAPLQDNEILHLVPSGIEFSDKTDEFVFNIIATYKVFEFIAQDQNHEAYACILSKSLRHLKKEDFQKHVHEFRMRCSTHLGTLRLTNGKKDKIRRMVNEHLQVIIEKMQVNSAHNNVNN